MTFQQFLLILKARSRLIWTILSGTILATLVVSLLLPKEYTASTSVVIDVKSPDPIAGMVLPGMMTPGYMATQVDIINSDRVAQRVIKLLKLDENPAIQSQWQDATEGQSPLVPWLAKVLQKKLDVKPSRESNVVTLNYSGSDPKFAAALANAFAQAYIDVNLELRVEPARQYAAWFDGQLAVYRERLEKAQKALSDYQQETGIVATDERLDYENAKLNELSAQMTIAQTQTADSQSKQKSGGADTLAEVMQNPVINGLKADLARLEAKLKEAAQNLGSNHPQYQRQLSEIAELRSRLAEETRQVTSSISTTNRVNRQRESELLAKIEEQKKKVFELKQHRDEISVLQREVESAQKAFDAVGQRVTQSRLESQSIQTNVAVLAQADEPTTPSSPKIPLNIVLSVFMGVVLSIGVSLVLELQNPRVRGGEDLAAVTGAPVLGMIPSTAVTKRAKSGFFRGMGRVSSPAEA